MDLSAQHLHQIHAAYSVGHLKPMRERAQNVLELEPDQAGYALLTPAEHALLRRSGRYRDTALQACREGKYGIAQYLLAQTEKLAQEESFSPMGRVIAQSTYEAAIAYLDYRCGRFALGTDHLYRALACDETLEERYGLTHYHIHRLRQLVNLVHLKGRQGAEKEAIHLGLALMNYLEQKVRSLPVPTTWNALRLYHLPLATRDLLFEMATCEMMFLLTGQDQDLAAWPALLQDHTSAAAVSPCQLGPRAHLWLRAQKTLLERDLDGFCACVLPLIAAGPGDSLWFWYGSIVEIVILCKDLASEPAELLLQAITDDLSAWRWSKFPPRWRHLFDHISPRVHVSSGACLKKRTGASHERDR